MISRHRLLRRALALSVLRIVISGIAGGTAVIVALSSGSLSLLGFGFDAAVDSAASAALVWRFQIEAREPHRAERVERIAESLVGAVLLLLAVYLGSSAVRAIAMGSHPDPSMAGTALLVFSALVLPPLALAKYRVARALASGALRADSVLTGVAALIAYISLAGLGLSQALGVTWADAVGALFVTAVLVREGWGSLRAVRTVEPISGSE